MPDPPSSPESRRRFLGRFAATLLAGVGVVAGGRAGARPAGATNCAIYCEPVSCGSCPGGDTYRCYSLCEGWLPYQCYGGHGCRPFCASQYAC